MPPGNYRHRTLAATNWSALPVAPAGPPAPGQVHLWRVSLAPDESGVMAVYETLLSPEELHRAGRFRFERDRTAFVVARASLRRLLGDYLDFPPEKLSFSYGKFGKPALCGAAQAAELHFNLSHAGGYALIGFATGRQIGVDLEAEDATIETERLTKRFFSPAESRWVLALPVADRVPAFFRTWTRKEAFLKANGAGLNLPLEQFSVTVNLDQPVRLEQIDWSPQSAGDWSMASFMIAAGLPGAVVVEGPLNDLCFYNLANMSHPEF